MSRVSNLYPSSPALTIFSYFYNGHPYSCEVISYYGFDLYFSDISDVEHLFIYLLAIFIIIYLISAIEFLGFLTYFLCYYLSDGLPH